MLASGGGGSSPKKFFRSYQKKFPGHFLQTYGNFAGHIKNFSLTSRNFRKDTIIFSEHQKFSEIFMFCPNVTSRAPPVPPPPAHTPMTVILILNACFTNTKTATKRYQ